MGILSHTDSKCQSQALDAPQKASNLWALPPESLPPSKNLLAVIYTSVQKAKSAWLPR